MNMVIRSDSLIKKKKRIRRGEKFFLKKQKSRGKIKNQATSEQYHHSREIQAIDMRTTTLKMSV